jgi:hypothetical protein
MAGPHALGRLLLRSARRLAVPGAAVALTVVLAQSTTTAAFTAATGDAGNSVRTATSFCTAPGTTASGSIGEDASTNGSGTNTGTTYNQNTMAVGTSPGGDGYLYIRFNLPSVPHGCRATSATLTLYAGTFQAASMSVYRVTAPWSETTLTWANQPAFAAGTPNSTSVTGTSQVFPVAAQLNDIFATANYGFVVKDALTLGGPSAVTRYQIYNSFSNPTNKPTLSITWG